MQNSQYSSYPSSTTIYPPTSSIIEPQAPLYPTATFVQQTFAPVVAPVPIDTSALEIRLRELWVQLERAKKKYSKYVTVAATTPAYFWIPVAGTISAPVIAGVYGDRASKKKKQIESKQLIKSEWHNIN